jgi:hypothetical protein
MTIDTDGDNWTIRCNTDEMEMIMYAIANTKALAVKVISIVPTETS